MSELTLTHKKYLSLLLLVFQGSAHALLIRYSQVRLHSAPHPHVLLGGGFPVISYLGRILEMAAVDPWDVIAKIKERKSTS